MDSGTCSMTGIKYFANKIQSGKPNALLFFMPGHGVSANHYGYFFKGKGYEKLGGVNTYSLEGSYLDKENHNELLPEKTVLKNYQDFITN
jgi:hypothetical protein